jgi:hypothetical protein
MKNIKTIIVALVIIALAGGNLYFFGGQFLNKELQSAYNKGVTDAQTSILQQASAGPVQVKGQDGKIAGTLYFTATPTPGGQSPVVKENTQTINDAQK